MTYTVKYRHVNGFVWKTLRHVKGDLIPTDLKDVRVFILEDESRVEIPTIGIEFRFCPRRFLSIKQTMEKEAGQSIPINK